MARTQSRFKYRGFLLFRTHESAGVQYRSGLLVSFYFFVLTNSPYGIGGNHVDIVHQLTSLHFRFQEPVIALPFTLALSRAMGSVLPILRTSYVTKVKFEIVQTFIRLSFLMYSTVPPVKVGKRIPFTPCIYSVSLLSLHFSFNT
jgi:hypothetical protein